MMRFQAYRYGHVGRAKQRFMLKFRHEGLVLGGGGNGNGRGGGRGVATGGQDGNGGPIRRLNLWEQYLELLEKRPVSARGIA
jgi:hypothetical protein